MVYVTDYNLLKEGNIFNDTSVSTYNVTASGLNSLYTDETSVEAFNLPAGYVSSITMQFGEYFKVGCLKVYSNPVNINDISITYGKEYVDENEVTPVSSGTCFFGVIDDSLGLLNVTLSGSSDTSVYGIFLEGEKNESIGYGTSSSGILSSINIGGVPTGYYSPNPVKVDVYNEYPYEVDIMVSVAPTGSGVDNYIYLSTSKNGDYYGINQHGIKQPAFVPISTISETLSITDISDFLSRWDFSVSSSSYLSNYTGYLRLYSSNDYVPEHRKSAPYNGYADAVLVNKYPFTANQSFTISMEIRVIDATLDNMEEAAASILPNKFFLGFTDTYPIREHYINSPTKDRAGKSMAAVWVGGQLSLGEATDLSVGSSANDFDFDTYEGSTYFHTSKTNNNSHPIISSILLEYLSNYVFDEDTYLDGSTSAPWRTLRLSYDHRTRTAYYYFDNLSLGEYHFSSDAFFEECRFFFGFVGVGQFAVDMRNFSVERNAVYTVYTNASSASAYSSKDTDHLPANMINGVYDNDYFVGSWISDDSPESGDYFSVTFDSAIDVDAVRIRYPSSTQSISISGVVCSPPRYSLDSVNLYFDTGDIRTVDFSSSAPTGLDGWDVSYMTTTSGTIESVLGVTSVSGIISTLNDRGSSKTPVLVIDEIQFYTLSGIGVYSDNQEDSTAYPWYRGYSENIKHFGSSPAYELDSTGVLEVCGALDCSSLVRYSDYDASSPVMDNESYVYNNHLNHYFESVFMVYDRDSSYSEANILNGRTGWFWRFFDYPVNIKGLYLYVLSGSSSLSANVDKWKIQYLKEGGDPTDTTDWVDIPPKTIPFSVPGDYATYVDYLISNNDGEYYTDYMDSLDFVSGSLSLPSSLLCQLNDYNTPNYLIKSNVLAVSNIYIEFDEEYFTQGIKFVVADGYEDKSRSVVASGYTISYFMCYTEKSTGFYLSPVFDTGTKQNTERIHLSIDNYGGDSYAYYRSSSTAPEYRHNSAYERWETVCSPFGGMENIPGWSPFYNGVDIVSYGNNIYFLGQNTTKMVVFNVLSGRWSWGAEYPTETTGEDIKPDLLTTNNTVVLGTDIFCACTSDGGGGTRTSGMMVYHLVANIYGYSGWELFPYQRQVEAVYASMVSDGNNRIFFFGRDGTVTVFYTSNGAITTEDRQSMPLYGYTKREYFVPAYVNGKIYVFGGSASVPGVGPGNALDIYDVDNDVWSTGSSAPYKIERATAIHYNGYIYVLPNGDTYGAEYAIFMKYHIQSDSWTVLPQLGYNYCSHYVAAGAGITGNSPVLYRYFICGEYIYGFNYINTSLDFRRFKVSKDSWEPGYLPISDDTTWDNNGGIQWNKVTSVSGETMPQDRYLQYKVVLEASDGEVTPILRDSTIVQPLRIESVPVSGTSSFYVKTGVSVEQGYEAWYTGFTPVYGTGNYYSSILYSRSSNGYEFNKSISSLYDITTSGLSGDIFMYYDSCVIKEDQEYDMWATHAKMYESGSFDITYGNIHRVTVSGGYKTYSPQHVVARGTEGTYDTESVYSPSVVKSDSEYKMWYTAVDSSDVHRILYADSTDGYSWGNHRLSHDKATTSLEPDADFLAAKKPSVININDVYYMWYEGVDALGESRIIYCFSYDGLNWFGHLIVIDKEDLGDNSVVGCGSPNVIYDVDTYKIWFIAYGSSEDVVYYAESPSGTTWSNFKLALSRKHEGTYDFSLISSICVISNRDLLDVPTVHSGKIKIYND